MMNTLLNLLKIIFFLFLIVLNCFVSNAQIDTKPINYNNKAETVLQNEIRTPGMANKISSVNVIDARDDTSALGYYSLDGFTNFKKGWPKTYYFNPSSSVNASIEKWVSNYLQLSNDTSILNKIVIVIKKLWISQEIAPVLYSNEKQGQPKNGWDAGIISRLEFYLNNGSAYYPLFRVDSIFTFKEQLPAFAGEFIKVALKNSLTKLYQINLEEIIAKRRKLSYDEIVTSNAKKSGLPILNFITYKKGAYKNFEEFKNNSPSIIEYELREGKLGDILYVRVDKKEYPERNAWGFCDGVNLFINSGDKYSKLIRHQNTFYFAGIKSIDRNVKHELMYTSLFNLATNTGRKKTSFKAVEKYYQVDMDTGEIY